MSVITNFVEHYQGPKLAILATGGGMGLAQIASVPGASRVFHSFYCPYETKESVRFLRANLVSKPEPDGFLASAVSQLAAEEFYEAMESKYRDCNVLVVTADASAEGVPTVVGEAIDWLPTDWVANIDDAHDIARVANNLLSDPRSGRKATQALEIYTCNATKTWIDFLQNRQPNHCG